MIFYRNSLFLLLFVTPHIAAKTHNPAWLKKDKKILEETLNIVEAQRFSITATEGEAAEYEKSMTIFPELVKATRSKYGGYLSIYFEYLVYKNQTFELDIWIPSDKVASIQPLLKRHIVLRDAFEKAFKRENEAFHFRYHSPKLKAELQAAAERMFGTIEAVELDTDQKAAFQVLTDPSGNDPYGFSCGYGGGNPRSRVAFESLLPLKSAKVYRNILRGIRPEGKVYAIEGLLRLVEDGYTLSSEDQRLIKAAKEAHIDYRACEGCLGGRAKFSSVERKIREYFSYEKQFNQKYP